MTPSTTALVSAVAAAFGAALVVAFGVGLWIGRPRRRDLRDVLATLEEWHAGHLRRRVEIGARSPLAPVAEAVNRLGQDLASRTAEGVLAEKELDAVLEAAHEYAVVTTDGDWDVRSFSATARAVFGWEPDAVLGRGVSMLFDEATWKDLLPKMSRRSLRDRGVDMRGTMTRRDGSKFPARIAVRVVAPLAGEPAGFLLVVHDVSADVRTENELRDSERRFRSLLEGLPIAIGVARAGRLVYGNPALARLLGATPADLASIVLRDRVATSDVLVVQEALARAEADPEGGTATLLATLVDPRGTAAAIVRLTAAPVRIDGAPAVLVSLVDETREIRAARELQRNEARLDAVVEAASEGLVLLDDGPSGAIVRMANEAFAAVFGVARARLLGIGSAELAALLKETGPAGARAAALLGGRDDDARDTVEFGPSDAPRAFEIEVRRLRGARGLTGGRLIVTRDVSRLRDRERTLADNVDELRRGKDDLEQAYREVRQQHEDLEARQQDLDRLNQELRTLDAMKADLLANVSHELQTPLVSIRGYTEMILKERLGSINEEQKKGLSLSLRNIDRLIGLIDNLLALAKVDHDAAELNMSVFAAESVAEEALDTLVDRIRERRVSVIRSYAETGLPIRADRDKIYQVFLNLLSNAVKYNRDGGEIEIAIRSGQPGYALVQVRDTGVGIPDADLERIFERFYRATVPEAARPHGSGIGLSIVRSILRMHRCSIRATSRVGQGTTFTFTLPVAAEVEPVPPTPTVSEESAPPADRPAASGEARRQLRIIRR